MFEVKKCKKKILSYEDIFEKFYYDQDFINETLDDLYFNMKEMALSFENNGVITDDYKKLIKALNFVESKLPNHFIIENNPKYDLNNQVEKGTVINKSEEEILSYIVDRVRSFLVASYSYDSDLQKVNLANISLINECVNACDKINFVCQAIKIPCKIYTIYPAFCSSYNVYGYGGIHQFCIITLGNREFLIDLTYSQFFTMSENNLNRIGVPLLGGCKPGVYMTLDKNRKSFAKKLLHDGWFEVSDDNLKMYFDGFAMSYRNGLYYERQGKIEYKTDYSKEDYIKFINGQDDQINHEGAMVLGRQMRLLNNHNKRFNIK